MKLGSQNNEVPQDIVSACKKHVPHHIVCDYLKNAKKPHGRSWDDTFKHNSTEQAFFLDLLADVLCFSRKTIFVYDVEPTSFTPLDSISCIQSDVIQALKKYHSTYQLFSRKVGKRFSAYTFICTRRAQETHVLTQTDLTQDAQQRFYTPDSVIKLNTKVQVTVFDSIIYDSENKRLFVAIDDSRFIFEESAFDMQSKLTHEVADIIPSLSKLKLMDFYPAIETMYQNDTEGLVHRLAFECNTGAVRDEKLKQGQLDLRAESYHTSGKAAIGGVIYPYKLGVTWHPRKYDTLASEIELEINGNRQSLHRRGGVHSCEIKSHGTFNELCFALDRVSLYVA